MARQPEVRTQYPDLPSSGESFLSDWRSATAAAVKTGDVAGEDALKDLWLDRFEHSLGGLDPASVAKQLEKAQVWRWLGPRPIYKFGAEPSLVFSANLYANGDVDLFAIGTCYKYPGGSETTWWTSIIQPRAGNL